MAQAKRVVLGVTGSIAAYKAAELARMMIKRNWEVSVIMNGAAMRFVGALTFFTLTRRPVVTDMFEAPAGWCPTHVALADWADVLLIAPCTANVMAKLAVGLADDALTSTALACAAPLVIAPAMNDKMWSHPATQANTLVLRERGAIVVDVGQGDLACAREGRGRLAELDVILKAVEKAACKEMTP